ncbi:hypothetical protein BDN70DRAFT_946275 [Pholiota conissans]|uniref:DNA polymerase epsilon catalytic subunit n=1 Tax=Pholiota conissans TaxID=109636 RepID=A0A9P5YJG5_9AGAR|nr:hypothetical protein BDN70DRAFT_946275 [Pholiota conissans]
MFLEIGIAKDPEDEHKSRVHMDCFHWVKRDSDFPQGSQGLKAVTVNLGYNHIELDPELMIRCTMEYPQKLLLDIPYFIFNAVATYCLYMKYVHPFVFTLTTSFLCA